MRAASLLLLLITSLMAGCTEPPAAAKLDSLTSDAVPSNVLKDGRDLRVDLQETDVIESAQWKIGDEFGHHVFFEGGPEEGLHIQTYVVDDKGDSWLLATDDKQMAKFEAIIDIPILGALKKKDLSGTGFGAPWEPYVFPLKQGATWTKEVESGDPFEGDSQKLQVKFDVVYNPAISTPDGDRPGFDITGTTADGKKLLAYDYVPDIQWYAHFYSYNIGTEDPEDYDFHSMSMGHGSGWTGTYYVDEAKVLVEEHHGMAVNPDAPAEPYADPKPALTFTVEEGATYVYGFAFSFSFLGLQETIVMDPDNNRHEFQAVSSDPSSPKEASGEIDVAAKPGDWKVVGVGGGAVAVWGVFFWQITEVAKTL